MKNSTLLTTAGAFLMVSSLLFCAGLISVLLGGDPALWRVTSLLSTILGGICLLIDVFLFISNDRTNKDKQ